MDMQYMPSEDDQAAYHADMLAPEEQLMLARESDPWAGYEQDLNARRQECERIIAKAAAVLTHDEIAALRYECGLDIH